MCSIVILRREGHDWPVLIAANRDEMADRPWRPPARHWEDRPNVVAGRDELAGGTWLGVNDEGVVAGILNRVGTLGPMPGKRSRGELVLEALDHADAVAAAGALEHLDPRAYRPFNMVVADNRDAYWLRNDGRTVEVLALPEGLSMITAHDRNDTESARIRFHLPRFAEAPAPDPDSGDWRSWEDLLASREHAPDAGPRGAMTVVTESGFGTVSGSLIALPAIGLTRDGRPARPLWRFAAGRPGETPWRPVEL